MPRLINRLTARTIAGLSKPGLHADGGGLYLRVKPTGSKSWVLIFHQDKKRREMGLGSLTMVTLAEAREKARGAQKQRQAGSDPIEMVTRETFGMVALALIESLRSGWGNAKHEWQWKQTLEAHAASIWDRPVASITTDDVLSILTPIWTKIPETAARVRGRIERVLDAAKARGLRDGDNPARWKGHLSMLLPQRKAGTKGHHAAMPYASVPTFIARLQKVQATSALALEFTVLTAARTTEVLNATWSEIDLDLALWTIPAERMKARKAHRVPLAARALAILQRMAFTGTEANQYVFAGHDPSKPLSNMSMMMVLRRMDLDDFTVHGFRSSFRDWCGEETDCPREVAEVALAHAVGNEVERAYRRGDALEKRRELMTAWAAHITVQEPHGACH